MQHNSESVVCWALAGSPKEKPFNPGRSNEEERRNPEDGYMPGSFLFEGYVGNHAKDKLQKTGDDQVGR